MSSSLDDARQSLVVLAAQVADAPTHLADKAADLLASGESYTGLGRLFGITRQSAAERFSISPQRDAQAAARRIESWHGRSPSPARISTVGRFVVFDDGQGWRTLRHATAKDDALALAIALGERRVARLVKKPADLDPDDVAPWALGPYALLTPEGEA